MLSYIILYSSTHLLQERSMMLIDAIIMAVSFIITETNNENKQRDAKIILYNCILATCSAINGETSILQHINIYFYGKIVQWYRICMCNHCFELSVFVV